jgi:hypothetical protein
MSNTDFIRNGTMYNTLGVIFEDLSVFYTLCKLGIN